MFPVTHQPEKRREGTDVHSIGSDGDKMRANAIEFCHEYTDILNSFWNLIFYAEHFLHADSIGMLAVHGCHVIKPIHERYDLIVRKVLGMFFETTVEVPNMRNNFFNNLSIH